MRVEGGRVVVEIIFFFSFGGVGVGRACNHSRSITECFYKVSDDNDDNDIDQKNIDDDDNDNGFDNGRVNGK